MPGMRGTLLSLTKSSILGFKTRKVDKSCNVLSPLKPVERNVVLFYRLDREIRNTLNMIDAVSISIFELIEI